MSRAKSTDMPVTEKITVIAEAITDIVSSPETTQGYNDTLDKMKGSSAMVVEVAQLTMGEGYKSLPIAASKETISFRNEDDTIGYKTLTHVLSGKTLTFGLACSAKGNMKLYTFLPEEDPVDARYLAELKVSRNVVDPMYAIVSEDKLYIIYNVPSERALASTPSGRAPEFGCGGEVAASGAPNIACFNLKTHEQCKLLPKISSMDRYACALSFNEEAGEPVLLVSNIYDKSDREKEKARPSLATLIYSLVNEDDATVRSVSMPVGLSCISFVEKAEVLQVGLNDAPTKGICSVILIDDKEDDYRFIVDQIDDTEETA